MDIVVIGTGNAATVLAKKFLVAGHRILQIVGRDGRAAEELAHEVSAAFTNDLSRIITNAHLYLLAISDEGIADISKNLHLPGRVVAHTAASVGKDVLKSVSIHFGVFYPLQTLRRDIAMLPEIPVFIDGSDTETMETLRNLAQSISGQNVFIAGDDERIRMHVAAVFASNFTNHLYKLAEDFCKSESVDFKRLLPLIEETVRRLRTLSPAEAQTGPAIRHDEPTIQKHLSLLEEYPRLKHIYSLMTESIQNG